MPFDYDRIREKNLYDHGHDKKLLAVLGELYTKKTHFIYELIQNAEDAEAKQLRFRLYKDRLEVENDGRHFNEPDVRGVCGVGEGTKNEDLTKIGKFGIGFKSIYLYTDRPEVHSGDEHFRIESYIRPYPCEPKLPNNEFKTLFVLPFVKLDETRLTPGQEKELKEDHIKLVDLPFVKLDAAFQEIRDALRRLSPRTVLFLRHIESLEMVCAGDEPRKIEHIRTGRDPAEVLVEEGDRIAEEWRVFEHPVELDGVPGLRAEIAFMVSPSEDHRIVGVNQSPLCVFFPTEKETNLGFLVQGPYRTTPARDNIPEDDDTNHRLILETAQLVVTALEGLRDKNLLTVEVLQTLPIEPERFPESSMFRPIYDAVREALLNKPLLPAHGEHNEENSSPGPFISGREAKLAGSSELRNLLSGEQLAAIYGAADKLSWVGEAITKDKTPTLWQYLRSELNVEELDAEAFVRRLDEKFLEKQTDEWLNSFYGFLLGQGAWLKNLKHLRESAGKYWVPDVPFMKKPIIRLSDDRHIAPFSDEYGKFTAAFLPGTAKSDLPTVKATIAENKEARDFLCELGFNVPDIVDEVLERILARYPSPTADIPPSYWNDVEAIMEALRTDSEAKKKRLLEGLRKACWFLAENAEKNDRRDLIWPSVVYVRSPELEMYFAGNSSAWFLDGKLKKYEITLIEENLLSKRLKLYTRFPDRGGYVSLDKYGPYYQRGLNGFYPGASFPGLDFALKNPTIQKSQFVWNSLLLLFKSDIKGLVQVSMAYGFGGKTTETKEEMSEMGKTATKYAWLPSRNGEFHRPCDLRPEDLPEGFVKDEELAKKLNLKVAPTEDNIGALAKAAGIDRDILEDFINNPDEAKAFKDWRESRRKPKPKAPVAASRDSSRREEKIKEAVQDAPPVKREERTRTIRVSKGDLRPEIRGYLQEKNTNEDKELICQLCQEVMPFKVQDGYYFEATECVWDLGKEIRENHLALCPNCAAMYEHANPNEPEDIKELILKTTKAELQISLTLAEQPHSIRFTEVHLEDLQGALSNL